MGVGIDSEINKAKNKRQGYLTLFESTDDYVVTEEILEYACNWLKEKGMDTVLGPISPTRGDDYRGMLVKGFDSSPVLMNPYNPEYYPVFFERYGFHKETDFHAYYYDLKRDIDNRLKNGVETAMSRYGFDVHPIDLTRLHDELRDIKQIIDESMPEEWGYLVPSDLSDIEEVADKLIKLAEPTLVHIARKGDKPIGFGLAMPDYNQVLKRVNERLFPIGFLKFLWFRRRINGARFFVMFVVPDYHKKGVSAAIYLKTLISAQRLGYVYGEGSQIDDQYPNVQRR